ncbi:MAG TPA: aspartyl protease family protein [Terracidiphilus sp.]|nr:aspartyl protease family protein [Terracidiphilus sp.]
MPAPRPTRIGILVLGIALISLPARARAQQAPHFTPMEVVDGKPYVQVTINGQGPYRFLVDTGTGAQALVTTELADVLHLPVEGRAHLVDPSGQGRQHVEMVRLDSLTVAGVRFTQVRALRHPLAGEDSTCQGLLGFALFRQHLLTLDYPNRRLTLATGRLDPDGEHAVLPFRMPAGVPIVPVRVGGKQAEAQVDSGGVGLSLSQELAARVQFSVGPEVFAKGESLSTRFELQAGKLKGDVQLGRYRFQQPLVEINPAFPLVNLGAAVLVNFTATFDQEHQLMRLDARKKTFHINSLPTPMQLRNAPQPKENPALVPVG